MSVAIKCENFRKLRTIKRGVSKALRVSTISIGMILNDDPARRGRTMRDVPEESLMLTGDENIVDVDFTVLWRIKPDGVGDFLFNIQNPEGTVKAVAESAMREVISRSNIQPIYRDLYRAGRAGSDAKDAGQSKFPFANSISEFSRSQDPERA